MKNLKLIVNKNYGFNLDAEIYKRIDETNENSFTNEEIKEDMLDALAASPDDQAIFNAAMDYMMEKAVDSAIRRRKNIKYIDENGQLDYLAFESMVVNVDRGQYILMKYANIDVIEIKKAEQINNIEAAINKRNQFDDVVNPIQEYMIVHGIQTVGEAIKLMGLN